VPVRLPVRAVIGVRPAIAIALGTDQRTAYVRAGYFPQLEGFPLHRQLFARGQPVFSFPPFCGARSTLPRAHLGGLVVAVAPGSLAVRGLLSVNGATRRTTVWTQVDAKSIVSSRRAGIPHAVPRARVWLNGILCAARGQEKVLYAGRL